MGGVSGEDFLGFFFPRWGILLGRVTSGKELLLVSEGNFMSDVSFIGSYISVKKQFE